MGDGTVFAQIPEQPGFPEGIAIGGGNVFVSGPDRFGTAGTGPSKIYVHNLLNGKMRQEITIQNEDLNLEHALSGIALDACNRLYVISTQLGILRFRQNRHHLYIQEQWADPIPDLNPYDPVPALPNDMVFDQAGNLYITDSLQATIWRIPPAGGTPEIWFQSPELAVYNELQMGPNGIRLSPGREYLYFVFSGSLPGDAVPRQGRIYRLPLKSTPELSDLELVYTFPDFEVPDGLAFDARGRLFVVMGGAGQISVLRFDDPDNSEIPVVEEEMRLSGPDGSTIPYVQPANIAFASRHSKFAYIVNHALIAPPPPNFFSVLKVYVGVGGDRLIKPLLP
ncbi:MAG: hypothetical protein EHM45_02320 [Desulfobacteraceae bacterium]|nr:MAG: hypothetical protein EHM45_02320 [Desulfobacteraceae bacterium]